jgi:hypothetical protein
METIGINEGALQKREGIVPQIRKGLRRGGRAAVEGAFIAPIALAVEGLSLGGPEHRWSRSTDRALNNRKIRKLPDRPVLR